MDIESLYDLDFHSWWWDSAHEVSHVNVDQNNAFLSVYHSFFRQDA
jgi:hypothetical protein